MTEELIETPELKKARENYLLAKWNFIIEYGKAKGWGDDLGEWTVGQVLEASSQDPNPNKEIGKNI